MKDMLLTYNEYNKDLGYVQGMSDLLAPIYATMQDDAIAFWAFVGFMERMVCASAHTHSSDLADGYIRSAISSVISPGCDFNS